MANEDQAPKDMPNILADITDDNEAPQTDETPVDAPDPNNDGNGNNQPETPPSEEVVPEQPPEDEPKPEEKPPESTPTPEPIITEELAQLYPTLKPHVGKHLKEFASHFDALVRNYQREHNENLRFHSTQREESVLPKEPENPPDLLNDPAALDPYLERKINKKLGIVTAPLQQLQLERAASYVTQRVQGELGKDTDVEALVANFKEEIGEIPFPSAEALAKNLIAFQRAKELPKLKANEEKRIQEQVYERTKKALKDQSVKADSPVRRVERERPKDDMPDILKDL